MSRALLAMLLGTVMASCQYPPMGPDLWALSLSDASGKEIYLGGHYTAEQCKKAGFDWFMSQQDRNYVIQCRLNCRKLNPGEPAVCEATEPVG